MAKKRHSLGEKLDVKVPDHIDLAKRFQVYLPEAVRENLTWGDLLEHQLIQSACRGNAKALQDAMDRIYGKVVQTTENKNLNADMNYTDFLDKVGSDESIFQKTNNIIAKINAPPSPTDGDEDEDVGSFL